MHYFQILLKFVPTKLIIVALRGVQYRCIPGKHPCTAFQGATVAASILTYGILIPDSAHAGQNCLGASLGHYDKSTY